MARPVERPMSADWQRLWDIFFAALERPPGERARFLSDACGADQRLRNEIEELIRAHERQVSILDRPTTLLGTLAAEEPRAEPLIGTRIGRYRIVRENGVGG